MANKIAAGGTGPAEFVTAFGTNDSHTTYWRVLRSGTIVATSAGPNGFAVTEDAVVTVPAGTALGALTVEIFHDDQFGDFLHQFARYAFEVVCLTVTPSKQLLASAGGIWTVKVLAPPQGGVGPFSYTWHLYPSGVNKIAGGGASDNFVTIETAHYCEVSVSVVDAGSCSTPLETIPVDFGSMGPVEPTWWPEAWAWPPSQTPPSDFPECRPATWPAIQPLWLSTAYHWPWPESACIDAAYYCVERTYTPSQVIHKLINAGMSGVSFDGVYFTIPPAGRTLEQVRELIEAAGITIGALEPV